MNDNSKEWNKLIDAYQNDQCVKAEITHTGNSGIYADINGIVAYIPDNEIATQTVKKCNFDKFIGKVFNVKLLVCNQRRKNLIVSRRKAILEK